MWIRKKNSFYQVNTGSIISLVKLEEELNSANLNDINRNIINRLGIDSTVDLISKSKEVYKRVLIRNLILQYGGKDKVPSKAYLLIANELKNNVYPALEYTIKKYNNNEITLAQATFRLRNKVKISKWLKPAIERFRLTKSLTQAGSSQLWAYRKLGNTDKSCKPCVSFSEMGVVKASNLPLPTEQCFCRDNCLCTIYFFSTFGEAIRDKLTRLR